jgi:hypothetical protein
LGDKVNKIQEYAFKPPNLESVHGVLHDLTIRFELTANDSLRAVADIERAPDDEYLRRSAIRTICANMESEVALLKTLALEARRHFGSPLSEKELRDLEGDRSLNALQNFKLALAALATCLPDSIEYDSDPDKFAALGEAIRIRNRVTHPKRLTDFVVTRAELLRLLSAYEWYKRTMTQLFVAFAIHFRTVRSQASTFRRASERHRPNDLCHCGSGIKFKRCHGRV